MFFSDSIFNVNDITLILVIFESISFSILLLAVREGRVLSCRILSLFLLATGCEALDTLMYWCAPLKNGYLADHVYIFFIFKVAAFLQGPLLYLYTTSVLYGTIGPVKKVMLHGIPALLFPAYFAIMMAELGHDTVVEGVFHYSLLLDSWAFNWIVYGPSVLTLVYALACVKSIRVYVEGLKETYSNVDKIDRNWLKLLIYGFLFTWCWNFANIIFATTGLTSLSALFGLTGNYYDLIFIKALAFYNLLYSRMALGRASPRGLDDTVRPVIVAVPGERAENDQPSAVNTTDASNTDATNIETTNPKAIAPSHAVAPVKESEPAAIAAVVEPAKPAVALETPSPESTREDSDEVPIALVNRLVALMEQERLYLEPELTVDQLARAARLPARQTSNIINRHFGVNFFEYVNNYRIEHAKALLLDGSSYSIIDISEMSGFNSKSAFNRFFKKITGKTPSEHRKSATQ